VRVDQERLARAWTAWSERPGNALRAHLLEDEVQIAASRLGITGSQLRDRVTSRVIAGLTLTQAIERVAGQGTGR
jgi:hypothetical protein